METLMFYLDWCTTVNKVSEQLKYFNELKHERIFLKKKTIKSVRGAEVV